jgi:predicted short-subunit dehydrogenase-like oxidoreductase (DUF2520 family)
MNIVLIGSGNVATVLGKKIIAANHKVVQVLGRNETTCAELAALLNCPYTINGEFIYRQADLYLIAIADKALTQIEDLVKLERQLVVHTAGAISKEVLSKVSKNYGVLYPLQSLHKEQTHTPAIPFLIDANTADCLALLMDFAETLSSKVQIADDETRKKIHLAAVLVNNFTNHLYALAEQYCRNEHLDFQLLLPLMEETVKRIQTNSPALVQTGPAVRGDDTTIQLHLQLLEKHFSLRKIYEIMTKSIEELHSK